MSTQSPSPKKNRKSRDTKPTKNNQSRNLLFKNHPIKVAVMIDGGFFIKRYNYNWNKNKEHTAQDVVDNLYTLAHNHIGNENFLYRIFYYDCLPLEKRVHNPIIN